MTRVGRVSKAGGLGVIALSLSVLVAQFQPPSVSRCSNRSATTSSGRFASCRKWLVSRTCMLAMQVSGTRHRACHCQSRSQPRSAPR